jgi:PHP family Zn ribbon phosphoesterase
MLERFRADLHVHTCLSPCGSLEMGPRRIVSRAADRALDVIGISDHNSCGNAAAVMKAAGGMRLKVLPGMEVTSREEVHILALFESIDGALRLQQIVYDRLPGTNDENAFGLQVIVNEDEEVLGFDEHLLAGATELSVEEVVDSIHAIGGAAIASHVDRLAFGIIGQLGFIPDGLELDALELSPVISLAEMRRRFPQEAGRCLVRSSDAHWLKDIGTVWSAFWLKEPSLAEMKRAFRGAEGREVAPADVPADCGGDAART